MFIIEINHTSLIIMDLEQHIRSLAYAGLFLVAIYFTPQDLNAQCSLPYTVCPGDLTIIDCDNSTQEIMDWPQPVVNPTAFCYNFTLTQIAGPQKGSSVPLGTYLIRYQAEAQDINSQIFYSNNCQFFVTVAKDVQPPVFTYCPPNITIYGIDNGTGNCTTTAYWPVPISTDNCDNNLSAVTNTPCGTAFTEGTHTVNYTSTDPSGNASTCSFTVTVICTNATNDPNSSLSVNSIHPNPTSGEIIIQLSDAAENNEVMRIVSFTGQVLLQKTIKYGLTADSFDASVLPSGMYFLQIVSKGQVMAVNKFVKQ